MTPSFLSEITERLTPLSDTPALDASVLLAHITNKPRTWVLAHPELSLTSEQNVRLIDSLMRLERGESFPYVLGHWEFFGMDFDITHDVLIPRPETELLVERAISWLQASTTRRAVADVGTGSGVIGVSIAVNVPEASILATDISQNALDVAKRNAQKFGVSHRLEFRQCDLLPQKADGDPDLDLICANLPYIPTQALRSLPIFGREPTLALDGGEEGLDKIRRLLQIAPEWISANGTLLLEIESTRGGATLQLAQDLFPRAVVHLHRDLANHDRLLEINL